MAVPEGVLWRGVAMDLEKDYRDLKDKNKTVNMPNNSSVLAHAVSLCACPHLNILAIIFFLGLYPPLILTSSNSSLFLSHTASGNLFLQFFFQYHHVCVSIICT